MTSNSKVPAVVTRPLTEMPVLQYDWFSPKRRKAALRLYQKWLHTKEQGLVKQGQLVQERLMKLYSRDYSEKVVAEAKDFGLNAKPFAVIPRASEGRRLTVEGDKWQWDLVPVTQVGSVIPAQALKAIAWSNSLGLEQFWVAFPSVAKAHLPGVAITRQLVTSTAKAAGKTASLIRERMSGLDPVLVVLVGRSGIMVELCRWE